MKYLFYIILVIISCDVSTVKSQEAQYYEEFYKVLNDLVRIQLTNVSVIRCETNPVYKTMWGNEVKPDIDTLNLSPPPSIGFSYIDANYFSYFVRWNRLDSVDANYMFNSIDSSITFNIDPNKVLLPVLDSKELSNIFNSEDYNEGYNRIRSIYGTSCFIIVSTPVFNKDYTKVLISIDYQCGPTWGQGYIFLLEKRVGLWWLVDRFGTWES